MKIGFCGMGMMGAPMAGRLLEAGHEVTVWNRTAEKLRPLVTRGARAAKMPAQVAQGADAVITMVSDEAAVRTVVGASEGLAAALTPGQTLLEMSTIGPDAVRRLVDLVPAGVEVVDAPVLGSIREATEGILKIFVGGSQETFDRVRPLLQAMGSPRLVGPFSAGAAMKLVVNSTLPTLMSALGESLALADSFGLDQRVVLDVLEGAAIGVTVKSKRSRIEAEEYPPNWKLEHALKDARLVNEAAGRGGRSLHVAAAAAEWLVGATDAGLGPLDYSALVAFIRGAPAGLPAG
ncbi:MAG TPA: NAD(P)-dependent oxidoreductase [Actinomycetota bacterium]